MYIYSPTGGFMIDELNVKQMLEKKDQTQLLRYYDTLSDREKETLLSELSQNRFFLFREGGAFWADSELRYFAHRYFYKPHGRAAPWGA